MRRSFWPADDANAPSTSRPRIPPHSPLNSRYGGCNVFALLARREVCPRAKRSSSKSLWGDAGPKRRRNSEADADARRALISWVEAKSLVHLSAKCCPLLPPPRSTIAAAFSPDGRTLASTHGDHTVKIIDCQTGNCIRVLSGHLRTPWVVRFHPLHPEILASGSLDHEVHLWDANTAECIGSCDFYRPIASIAFHAQGELLAVASGHKLYIWHYNKRGEASSPTVILKTRRSLRAVHFHPNGAPFLLTAENPQWHLQHPPTICFTDSHSMGHPNLGNELPLLSLPFLIWPSFARDVWRTSVQQSNGEFSSTSLQQTVDPSTSVRLLTYSTPSGQYELLLSPIEPSGSSPAREETHTESFIGDMYDEPPQFAMDTVETTEVQHGERNNAIFAFGDQMHWELPFLHGWLVGQSHSRHCTVASLNGSAQEHLSLSSQTETCVSSSVIPISIGQSRGNRRSGMHYRSSQSQTISAAGSAVSAAFNNSAYSGNESHPVFSRTQAELATSMAAAAAAELPCTVKLRIWPHDVKDACAPLNAARCRLTIPQAVLCSEMGVHFSPCGRFLAACVACMQPCWEADPGLQGHGHHNNTGVATSPTRHPISAHQVIYELRIYSLEEKTFGSVLAFRAIRAAHCLTSIQFSPTSEHLLLAYGRRHSSLLKSVIIDGDTTVPIYTILEVYRVADLELVRVLPSGEDEVNVACFHPSVGGGLVYGTKEGKLRILQHDSSHGVNYTTSSLLDKHMLEVPTFALEC